MESSFGFEFGSVAADLGFEKRVLLIVLNYIRQFTTGSI